MSSSVDEAKLLTFDFTAGLKITLLHVRLVEGVLIGALLGPTQQADLLQALIPVTFLVQRLPMLVHVLKAGEDRIRRRAARATAAYTCLQVLVELQALDRTAAVGRPFRARLVATSACVAVCSVAIVTQRN